MKVIWMPFVSFARRVKRSLAKKHPLQRIKAMPGYKLIHLGSQYGGWTLVDDERLVGCTIISAGLGEDASFDVEFARRFGAQIVIVDPTPRAIEHFDKLISAIKAGMSVVRIEVGNRSSMTYDLSGINASQLTLVPKALWNTNGTLKFYSPKNEKHVSHSIVNLQHNYRSDTDFIEVEAITISKLVSTKALDLSRVPLIKLDIEGAEIEVVQDFLACGIRPMQLCVEYDELISLSEVNVARVDAIDAELRRHNYHCVFGDGQANFLYVLNE